MDVTEIVNEYAIRNKTPRGTRPFIPFSGNKYMVLSKFNVLIYNCVLNYMKTSMNCCIDNEEDDEFKSNLRVALSEMVFIDVFGGSGVMSYSIYKTLTWIASKCNYKGKFNIVFNDYDDVSSLLRSHSSYCNAYINFLKILNKTLTPEDRLSVRNTQSTNENALYITKQHKEVHRKFLRCFVRALPFFKRNETANMLLMLKKMILLSSLFKFRTSLDKTDTEIIQEIYDYAMLKDYKPGVDILVDNVVNIRGNFPTDTSEIEKRLNKKLSTINEFLDNVEVVKCDFQEIFARYKGNDKVVFICDPPYPFSNTQAYNMDYFSGREYYLLLLLLSNTMGFFCGDNKTYILDFKNYLNECLGDNEFNPFFKSCYVRSLLPSRQFLNKNKTFYKESPKRIENYSEEYLIAYNQEFLLK